MSATDDRVGHAMQTLITTEAERMKCILDDGIKNIGKLSYIVEKPDPEVLCFLEESLASRRRGGYGLQGEEKHTGRVVRVVAALKDLWEAEESVLLRGNQQYIQQYMVGILLLNLKAILQIFPLTVAAAPNSVYSHVVSGVK